MPASCQCQSLVLLFQLRVEAYDDVYPEQTSTATININMIRNENRPQWTNNVPLNIKIRETDPLGYIITDVINATDADKVSLFILSNYYCLLGIV